MVNYDIIIVGCGTAGCTTGIITSKAGLKTLVIDLKDSSKIGNKVCGDAVEITHLEEVKKADIDLSTAYLNEISEMEIFPPSKKVSVVVKDRGFIVDRHKFGQALLKELINSGGTFIGGSRVLGPYIKNSKLLGIITKKEKFFGDIIVDASGVTGVLRKRLPFETDFPKKVPLSQYAIAYREIVELDKKIENKERIQIWYDWSIAPQGYTWCFPKSEKIVNLGIGFKGRGNPKESYKKWVRENYKIKKKLATGSAMLPLGKPFYGYVADNFLIVGDAAFQVNPLDGAGIGYSMRAGIIAGNTCVENIDEPIKENLWQYNTKFWRGPGSKHAILYFVHKVLLSLPSSDINYIFEKGLIGSDEIKKAYKGLSLDIDFFTKVYKFIKGFPRVDLLLKMERFAKCIKEMKRHFSRYPRTHARFETWRKTSENIFTISERKVGIQEVMD